MYGCFVRWGASSVICCVLQVFPDNQHAQTAVFFSGHSSHEPHFKLAPAVILAAIEGSSLGKKMNFSFICEEEEGGDVPNPPQILTWHMCR